MKKAIGIDIGGTKIAIGLVREDGVLLKKEEMSTEPKSGGENILSRLLERLVPFQNEEVMGLGVGTAGQVDSSGTIRSATDTFTDWVGMNLKQELASYTGWKVEVVGDVQAMGLGEQIFGAGQGVKDFLCMAIGTGVGGAIIADGHLIRGFQGAAGEWGHMILFPQGRLCPCGNHGCLEAHLSGTAIEARYKESFSISKSGKDIFADALHHDRFANILINQVITDLITGLVSLVHIFNPEKVILGGGVSTSLTPYMEQINHRVRKQVSKANQDIVIEQSWLRGDAMVVGAASLVM